MFQHKLYPITPSSRLHTLKIFANSFSTLLHATTCNRYAFHLHKLPFDRGNPCKADSKFLQHPLLFAATIFIDIPPFFILWCSAKGIEYTAYVRKRANVIREDKPPS